MALDAEVILLGTGKQLRFLRPELMQPLAASQGLEVMDIHAAARTRNLLTSEKAQSRRCPAFLSKQTSKPIPQ